MQLPSSALDQIDKGQLWDVVADSPIEGGHYAPLIGSQDDLLVFVSWGRVQYATVRFLMTYCDEAIAYLSEENLVNRKSADGFDYAALSADLKELA